jgi:hypothetical protein
LAAVWLMTSSNLVGCSTGRSPGFVPRGGTQKQVRKAWSIGHGQSRAQRALP